MSNIIEVGSYNDFQQQYPELSKDELLQAYSDELSTRRAQIAEVLGISIVDLHEEGGKTVKIENNMEILSAK